MKTLVVFLVSCVLFFCGMAAFAYNAVTSTTFANAQTIRLWVGKPASQVITSFGQPSSTFHQGRRTIYDYVVQTEHVGPIETYQFVIGPSGKVEGAKVLF